MASSLEVPHARSSGIATLLFVTVVHELRSDLERYQFSIDRCYTDFDQANERLELLYRCNVGNKQTTTRWCGKDHVYGCRWISVIDDATGKVLFFVEVRATWMLGKVNNLDGSTDSMVAQRSSRTLSTISQDLASHVFVIAVHDPNRQVSTTFDRKPSLMAWSIESSHATSSIALFRARTIWKKRWQEQYGLPEQIPNHFGLSRFTLLPRYRYVTMDWLYRALHVTGIQIRVERVRVVSPNDRVTEFVPKDAILYDKPFKPLCEGRETKILDRYMHELSTRQREDDLPWESDIAELELVDRLREKREAEKTTQRPPLPLKRSLRNIVAGYKLTIQNIMDHPVSPAISSQNSPTLTQGATSTNTHYSPALTQEATPSISSSRSTFRRFSAIRRSFSSTQSGGTPRRLQKRSALSSSSQSSPPASEADKRASVMSNVSDIASVRYDAVAAVVTRAMLTGWTAWTRF